MNTRRTDGGFEGAARPNCSLLAQRRKKPGVAEGRSVPASLRVRGSRRWPATGRATAVSGVAVERVFGRPQGWLDAC